MSKSAKVVLISRAEYERYIIGIGGREDHDG